VLGSAEDEEASRHRRVDDSRHWRDEEARHWRD
jgi:hypothetical protein